MRKNVLLLSLALIIILTSILTVCSCGIITKTITQTQTQTTTINRLIDNTDTTPQITIAKPALQIVSVTSPVRPGANATLVAQTTSGAVCSITVYYKSGASTAQGLYSKTADSSGRVSWTWKVGTRTTPGSWRIVVKASYGGQTVSQEIHFTVQ